MSELVLELSLKRSSGVLAGIVAALGQAGVHLQSQKLDRSGTGWLTIHAEGDPPDPAELSDRLNGTRGVDRLVRLSVDGETVIEDGAPVSPATAEMESDPIRAEDLAELSAGAARESVPDEADESRALDEVPPLIDNTEASDPQPEPADSREEMSPETGDVQTEALHADAADALASEHPPEPASAPVPQSIDNASAAEPANEPSGDDSDQHGGPATLSNDERVKLNLRRRRRRRR